MSNPGGGNYTLQGCRAHELPIVWGVAAPYIESALDKTQGEMGMAHVYEGIKERDMQLWLVLDDVEVIGALVTQIVEFPCMKGCRYVALGADVGGDFEEIDKMITEWAASMGCDRLEIVGRRGWTRALKSLGYDDTYSYVTKPIKGAAA